LLSLLPYSLSAVGFLTRFNSIIAQMLIQRAILETTML